MSAWADLAVLAGRELELAREGRWEEARALADERDARAPGMPAPRPQDRSTLELLLALQEQLVVECTLARDAAAREIAAMARGRGAVRGYASTTARPAARVDGAA